MIILLIIMILLLNPLKILSLMINLTPHIQAMRIILTQNKIGILKILKFL